MNTLAICELLGKFEHEVRALPLDEYARLVAYVLLRDVEARKQSKRARR